jgi:hypothetical protein
MSEAESGVEIHSTSLPASLQVIYIPFLVRQLLSIVHGLRLSVPKGPQQAVQMEKGMTATIQYYPRATV